MPTIWHPHNLPYKISIPAGYSSPYDDDIYQNVGNALINSGLMRENLLIPFHHVCSNHGFDWGIDVRPLLEEIKSIKSSTPEETYQKLIDITKNLPSEFIKHVSPTSLRVFLNEIENSVYYNKMSMNKDDSVPMNRFFFSVLTYSYKLGEIISELNNFKILQNCDTKFIFCERCKKVSVTPITSNDCHYCHSSSVEYYPMMFLPKSILSEWENGGDKFIEVMIYYAIKMASPDTNVYSNVNIIDNRGRSIREIDVYIKETQQEGCAILATKNPRLSEEKKQAKSLRKMGFDVILVTTNSTGGKMTQYATKTFTSVIEDSDFPSNLIEYLKANGIIQ